MRINSMDRTIRPGSFARWAWGRIFALAPLLLLAASLMIWTAIAGAQTRQRPQTDKSAKTPERGLQQIKPVLEPKAIEILKGACNRLAGAHSMKFTATVMYENPSLFGPPLAYMTKSEVTMQRPDKLRVITLGDGPRSDFYYNGKTMMAFAPAEDLLA